jgi:hypothetical protein
VKFQHNIFAPFHSIFDKPRFGAFFFSAFETVCAWRAVYYAAHYAVSNRHSQAQSEAPSAVQFKPPIAALLRLSSGSRFLAQTKANPA